MPLLSSKSSLRQPFMQCRENLLVCSIVIRQATSEDISPIITLVTEVVNETYGHLFEDSPSVTTDPDFWIRGWVADRDGKVVGVGLAEGDYVEDLWVAADSRGQQIGTALLSKLEDEIISNGHRYGRLRLVAENEGARMFYAKQGWRETRSYPHEHDGFLMVDFQKNFGGQ